MVDEATEIIMEAFNIGEKVCITTCYGDKYTGSVIAWDCQFHVLVLQTPKPQQTNMFDQAPSGKPRSDIFFLNLNNAKAIEHLESAPSGITTPVEYPNIKHDAILRRLEKNKRDKVQEVDHVNSNVTPQVQRLYNSLKHMLPDVYWEQDHIIVSGLRISAPYKVDNIAAKSSQSNPPGSHEFIRKQVGLFWSQEEAKATPESRKDTASKPTEHTAAPDAGT